jgi:SAM-dependent methyltransferase
VAELFRGMHAALFSLAMHSVAYELARCPVCNSADSHEIAGVDDVREEMEALWAFHTRRLRDDTPPERLTDRVAFSQAPPIRLVQCTRCETVFRNPRERAFEVTEMYADETPSIEVLQALHDAQRATFASQVSRLTEVSGLPGRGLEVGSYSGGFLEAARRAGWRFEGLDVNESANEFARALGYSVTSGDLASFRTTKPFDAVAIWNCFDQLPDPRSAARSAYALVKTNGVLAIRVPNGAFYAAVRRRLDGVAGPVARALLAHNNLLGFPYRHGFTVQSLSLLLEDTGFDVIRTHGDALVPIADEWTRGWAAAEERMIKAAMKALAALDSDGAPWFEVYARARPSLSGAQRRPPGA